MVSPIFVLVLWSASYYKIFLGHVWTGSGTSSTFLVVTDTRLHKGREAQRVRSRLLPFASYIENMSKPRCLGLVCWELAELLDITHVSSFLYINFCDSITGWQYVLGWRGETSHIVVFRDLHDHLCLCRSSSSSAFFMRQSPHCSEHLWGTAMASTALHPSQCQATVTDVYVRYAPSTSVSRLFLVA